MKFSRSSLLKPQSVPFRFTISISRPLVHVASASHACVTQTAAALRYDRALHDFAGRRIEAL